MTYFYLYKITNKVNGKFYVGVHKTTTMNDGYMGSGKVIVAAIEKYGVHNFTKEILEEFHSSEEMYAREKEFVTEELLSNPFCYNLRRGGFGGFDFINKTGLKYIPSKEQGLRGSDVAKAMAASIRQNYYKNPMKCYCGVAIEFHKRNIKKYCSSSCAAKVNNKGVNRHK